jgi:hypothetical protein
MAKSRNIHFIHPTMICKQLLNALSVGIKSYDKKHQHAQKLRQPAAQRDRNQ